MTTMKFLPIKQKVMRKNDVLLLTVAMKKYFYNQIEKSIQKKPLRSHIGLTCWPYQVGLLHANLLDQVLAI